MINLKRTAHQNTNPVDSYLKLFQLANQNLMTIIEEQQTGKPIRKKLMNREKRH